MSHLPSDLHIPVIVPLLALLPETLCPETLDGKEKEQTLFPVVEFLVTDIAGQVAAVSEVGGGLVGIIPESDWVDDELTIPVFDKFTGLKLPPQF